MFSPGCITRETSTTRRRRRSAGRRKAAATPRRGTLPRAAQDLLRRLLGGARAARTELALVDDATIARVHRRFLKESGATDVITFDYGEGRGEIVISHDTAARNARRLGHSIEREILELVAHGSLHLLGRDDDTPARRARMLRDGARAAAAATRKRRSK